MKSNRIKKMLAICLFAGTTILFSNTSFANAKEAIPQHMKPGSLIEIDDLSNVKIISGGYPTKTNLVDEMILPDSEPGMRISYDGMGLPNKIINKNTNERYNAKYIGEENTVEIDQNIDETPEMYFEPGRTEWKSSGWVTFFEDKIGQQDHELRDWDCATKMGVDDPPCGTSIRLRDTSKTTEALLAKWDIGSLPNAVLDIRPNMFVNTFGYNKDVGHFPGRYGHFFPYQ